MEFLKIHVHKFLLISTLIGVFSESFLLRVGFDLKLIYIIAFVNSVILILKYRYTLKSKFNVYLFFIFILGVATVFIYDNQINRVFFQIVGIFFLGNYFNNFFKTTPYSSEYIFDKYCEYVFYLCVIGLIIFFTFYFTGIDFLKSIALILPFGYPNMTSTLKVQSLMLEPAHFAGLVLPAFLYSLYNYRKRKIVFFTITLALFLSFSSVGYIGAVLALLISNISKLIYKITIITIAFLFAILAYTYIPDVKLRVDDTYTFVSKGDNDFSGLNLSTYAIGSNFYIASQVVKDSPFVGHGIGSHPISHMKYIRKVNSGVILDELGMTKINSEDANSLFIRVISEFGILGIFFVILFIVKNYSKRNFNISQSILLYFFYKLFREGHYFSPEMYFFIFLYIRLKYLKNNKTYKTKLQRAQ